MAGPDQHVGADSPGKGDTRDKRERTLGPGEGASADTEMVGSVQERHTPAGGTSACRVVLHSKSGKIRRSYRNQEGDTGSDEGQHTRVSGGDEQVGRAGDPPRGLYVGCTANHL